MKFAYFNLLSELPPHDQLVKIILSKIGRGELREGQKLPSVNFLLTEVYGDKTAIQDALNLLTKNEVIEYTPGKGHVIRPVL